MSAKKVFLAGLFGMCWSWCTAQAQEVPLQENPPPPIPQYGVPQDGAPPAPTTADQRGTGLSSWITYDRNNCCTGNGTSMPILTELLFRVGPSFPVGGEFFGRNLDVGWMIEGGARAMFFNPSWTAAWAAELGISNTNNTGHSPDTIFLDHNVKQFVRVRSFDRVFVNAAIGREWYLWAPADGASEAHLRWGLDVGGRYGAGTIQFIGVRHRTQVIEGFFTAIHADLEVPCGRCTYLGGLRTEYGFTYSNIFEQGVGNMQEITFLINLGVRY